MKYILLCLAALAVCLGVGRLPVLGIQRKKKLRWPAVLALTLAFGLLLMAGVGLGYLSVYCHADATAEVTSPAVERVKIDGGYLFDGPGADTALVFYPGAKVDTLAYAPLLTALAEEGVDCFLADMPLHMAIFAAQRADRFLDAYAYDRWAAAGHSMGGLVISGYATDHADRFRQLILLASYPAETVPDSITFCSVYGTEDGCLDRPVYEDSRAYWPEDAREYVLEGGNHAQYANYGRQKLDGEATISREEQQARTVEIILETLGKK